MKIKYYLRGFGTGILFATIILFISYSYRMSDSQIKKEAEKLGMVYAGFEKNTTSGSNSNMDSSASESVTPSDEITSQEATTPSEEVTTQEPTTPPEEVTSQEQTTPSEQVTSSNQNIEKCELTVKADTASYDVAYALMVAGIIDNAEEFDDYLCYNGYAKRIQNGTYVVTSDMTYEEIAELICRKYW